MKQCEHELSLMFSGALRRWVVAADGDAARKEAEKKFPGKVKGLSQVRAICHKDGQGTFCDHTYSAVRDPAVHCMRRAIGL